MSASYAYAQGPLSQFPSSPSALPAPLLPSLLSIQWTFLFLLLLHTGLTSAWTLLLPRIGLATATHASLLPALGLVVAGLARWGALV